MPQVLRDHFVREAGEYLAELDRLLRTAATPDGERLLRLALALRGSAQLVPAEGIAAVAGRLEGAARFVVDGRLPWSDDLRDRWEDTLADLRALVPRVAHGWDAAADQRVQSALARWGDFEPPADDEDAVPISALFYDDEGPHVIFTAPAQKAAEPGHQIARTGATVVAAADDAVPIESLLLRGDRALEEALALRPDIERLLGSAEGGNAELRSRLDELWDLMALGRPAGER